jgi:hypothetical protein
VHNDFGGNMNCLGIKKWRIDFFDYLTKALRDLAAVLAQSDKEGKALSSYGNLRTKSSF